MQAPRLKMQGLQPIVFFEFIAKERLTLEHSCEANCILLHCPETNGLRQLVNATGVNYYSAYSKNNNTGKNIHSLDYLTTVGKRDEDEPVGAGFHCRQRDLILRGGRRTVRDLFGEAKFHKRPRRLPENPRRSGGRDERSADHWAGLEHRGFLGFRRLEQRGTGSCLEKRIW